MLKLLLVILVIAAYILISYLLIRHYYRLCEFDTEREFVLYVFVNTCLNEFKDRIQMEYGEEGLSMLVRYVHIILIFTMPIIVITAKIKHLFKK